jgi:type IV pilus assembly protein PilB
MLELGFTQEEIANCKIYRGAGCKICNDSGYKGRVGLFEIMEITPELKEAIIVNATAVELRRLATAGGMITLRRSGLLKVLAGMTSMEEVVRETVEH